MIKLKEVIVVDFETTGTNVATDRIVSVGMLKRISAGGIESYRDEKYYLINPEMPIPASATEVHGITDEMVAKKPTFAQFAKNMLRYMGAYTLCGFCSNGFDFPILYYEFKRAGIEWNWRQHKFIDVGNLSKIMNPRTLGAMLGIYTGEQHPEAHNALADCKATLAVLDAMEHKHEAEFSQVDDFETFCNFGNVMIDLENKLYENESGDVVINFGVHKGELAKNNIDYLKWMLSKDFSDRVKEICNLVIKANS